MMSTNVIGSGRNYVKNKDFNDDNFGAQSVQFLKSPEFKAQSEPKSAEKQTSKKKLP